MWSDIITKVSTAAIMAVLAYLWHLVGRVQKLEHGVAAAKESAEARASAAKELDIERLKARDKSDQIQNERLEAALAAVTKFGSLVSKVETLLEATDRRLVLLERHVFQFQG